MEIKSCFFAYNFALETGGALLFSNKIPKNIMNNYFSMNQAKLYYGNDYASDPFRMLLENSNGFLLD